MTLNRSRLFLLVMFLLHIVSCKEKSTPFDKAGWNTPCDGIPCPVLREKMLDDLLNNHQIIGLTFDQVISKLGNVDNHEMTPNGIMRYEITAKYTMGDIVHITALDLHLNKDSIVTSWTITAFDVDM